MKKNIIPVLAGVFIGLVATSLVSCGKQPQPSADGYNFGKKQYELSSIEVEVKTYKTQKELQQILIKKKIKNIDNVAAFTVITPASNKCIIHMIDPAVDYEPEFIGHEFLHCIYGQWHTDNDSKS